LVTIVRANSLSTSDNSSLTTIHLNALGGPNQRLRYQPAHVGRPVHDEPMPAVALAKKVPPNFTDGHGATRSHPARPPSLDVQSGKGDQRAKGSHGVPARASSNPAAGATPSPVSGTQHHSHSKTLPNRAAQRELEGSAETDQLENRGGRRSGLHIGHRPVRLARQRPRLRSLIVKGVITHRVPARSSLPAASPTSLSPGSEPHRAASPTPPRTIDSSSSINAS
jgi:hypothetical protein